MTTYNLPVSLPVIPVSMNMSEIRKASLELFSLGVIFFWIIPAVLFWTLGSVSVVLGTFIFPLVAIACGVYFVNCGLRFIRQSKFNAFIYAYLCMIFAALIQDIVFLIVVSDYWFGACCVVTGIFGLFPVFIIGGFLIRLSEAKPRV